MIVKAIHAILGIIVALSTWSAVAILATCVAVVILHVLLMSGFVFYHLAHS